MVLAIRIGVGGLTAIALLLVSSCATPYQATGIAGGYEETWISEREVVVWFSANGYTDPKTAADYAAFRACEVTLRNGFSHFVVLEQAASGATETNTVRDERVEIVPNVYGGVTATTRPAETITVFKPSTRLHILLLKDDQIEAVTLRGQRAVSARFYIERNAPESVKKRILEAK